MQIIAFNLSSLIYSTLGISDNKLEHSFVYDVNPNIYVV